MFNSAEHEIYHALVVGIYMQKALRISHDAAHMHVKGLAVGAFQALLYFLCITSNTKLQGQIELFLLNLKTCLSFRVVEPSKIISPFHNTAYLQTTYKH